MKTTGFSIALWTLLAAVGGLLLVAAIPSRAADALYSAANGEFKPAQFVLIEGEVKIPQRYVYSNGMTLGAAIKIAKGVTAQASQKVTLVRQGRRPLMVNRETIERDQAKDIKLEAGDKVFVPKK